MINKLFPQPNVAEWSARAREQATERTKRTRIVNQRVLRVRPAPGLATGNMLKIQSRGKVIIDPRPRGPATEPVARPERPAIRSDAWRRDRLTESVRAPEAYHAAPDCIGAGRI